MSSHKVTHRFYVEKLGATNTQKFVSDAGDLFYDPEEGEIRLSDGVTEGGIPAAPSIVDGFGFIPNNTVFFKTVGLSSNTEYSNFYSDYVISGDNEIIIGENSEVIFDRFDNANDFTAKTIQSGGLNVDGVSTLGFQKNKQIVVGNINLENNTDFYTFAEELVIDPYIEIVIGSGSTVTMDKLNQITGTGGGGGESYWTSTNAGIHTLSKVGIGTTNPTANLQVQGDLIVSAGIDTTKYITIKAYEDNGGSLSFEGTEGQLFSITNNLTSGSIFNVNDINGDPILDANANGNLGIGTTNPTEKLTVVGNTLISGYLNATNNYYLQVGLLANQTIPNFSDTVVGFSTVGGNTEWYNESTHQFTPTVSGLYAVQAMIHWEAGSVNINQNNVQIRKNGTTLALSQVGIQTNYGYTLNAFGLALMNGTSDYIDLTVYTDNPTSQDITGTPDGAWTKMDIFKIN